MSAIDSPQLFGSTSAGFVPRRLADIQRAMNEKLALIVDPRSGEKPFQNASDDTILQQVVAIFAEAAANAENAAHGAFAMRDPLTAVGAGESHLVQLNAILRKPGAATVVDLRLDGAPGTLIPAGSRVGHPDGHVFATRRDAVLPRAGTDIVPAHCATFDPVDPAPGTCVSILTPVSGWDAVENVATVSVGRPEETDAELRARQQLSTNATSYRQIEAIRAAVANVPGVAFVRAYQNSTLLADERDIPGKCLAMVVVGGDNEDIARAILFRTPLGIGYHGAEAVTIYDDLNMGTTVQFSRPLEREIGVRVHLEIVVDERIQKFPSNGEDLVKQAILDFAATGHSLCEPIGNDGFYPGQDIIRSYLYTPINSIGGARVTGIELAVDGGTFTERDIAIAWNEIGVFAADRIEVDLP